MPLPLPLHTFQRCAVTFRKLILNAKFRFSKKKQKKVASKRLSTNFIYLFGIKLFIFFYIFKLIAYVS